MSEFWYVYNYLEQKTEKNQNYVTWIQKAL